MLPLEDDNPQPDAALSEITGVPVSVRNAIVRRRAAWTRTDTFAFALIGAHMAVLLLILPPGSLYLDDLRAQGYAQGQPFFEFIIGSNGTHFAPLPRIIDFVQSRVFPLQHAPAVLITMAVRLVLAVAFWRLLRRTFGPRVAALVPLALLLFTPALLPATAWFRQSITVLACTAAMVWAVDAHLRWVIGRRRIDLLSVGVATAVGLGFYEKAAVIPFAISAVSLAMFAGRSRVPGPRHPIRATFWSGLVSSLVVIGFLIIYMNGPYDQGPGTPPSPVDVLTLAGDTVGGTLIPLLLGGPWDWIYSTPYAGTPHVGTPGVIEALLATGVGLILVLRRSPARVARALLVITAWTLPSVAIITYGRSAGFEDVLADAVRLWADLVPALLFGAALAAIPWRIGVAAERAPAPVPDPQPAYPPPYPAPYPPAAGPQPVLATHAAAPPGPAYPTDPAGLPVPMPGAGGAGIVYAPHGDPVGTASYSISPGNDPVHGAPDIPGTPPGGSGRGRVTKRADGSISLELTLPVMAGLVAMAVVMTGSLVSTWTFTDRWWDNPTDTWLTNARTSLENAEAFPRVLATPLPEAVMPSWVTAEFPTVAPLVLLVRPDARFHDGDGATRTFDAAGNLVPVLRTQVIAQSRRAPVCRAVLPSTGPGARVPLTKPALYVPGAQLELGLLLNAPTRVEVMVETPDRKLFKPERWSNDDLPQGPHTLRFPVPLGKTVSAVRLRAADPGVSCVNSVRVLVAQP